MKKTTFAIVTLLALSTFGKAQSFKQGDKFFQVGVGLGSPYWNNYYFKASLPVNPTISWEKAVSDEVSAGGIVSYANSKWGYFKLNAFYIGTRGAYHFTPHKEKLDVYVGGTLGYIIITANEKGSDDFGIGSGLGYTVFGGGRYYFGKKLAVYGELGYGSFSILNAGLSFKM